MSGAPRPARYGWVLVATLGVTETVSYGVLWYALPVFIAPMRAELGWSGAALTGGFSLAALVAGLSAVPVGWWVDRRGARGVMSAGSLLAAAMLLAWSRVETLAGYYALSIGLGVAMAAVLYEPAFAVVARWFEAGRGRALTLLTFLGGFASVIFVPLSTALVAEHGWREALVRLAATVALLTALPHALLLRDPPASRRSAATAPGPGARGVVRSRSFRWLAAAFGLASLTTTAVAVHLIPLLLERGHDAAFAGAAMGAVGVMALPGRLVLTPLGDRWPRAAVTASIFALQTLGLAALIAARTAAGVWLFVALFGAGFGAISPARAALTGDLYGPERYATIGGALALVVALARAAAPIGASLLHGLIGYDAVLWTLLALSLASGAAVLAADRPERRTTLEPIARWST